MGSYKLSGFAGVSEPGPRQNLPRRHRGTEKRNDKSKLGQNQSAGCFQTLVIVPFPDLPARIDAILNSITLLLYQQHSYTLLEHSLSSGFWRRVVFSSSVLDRAQRVPHRTTQLRDAMKSAVKAASYSLFSILFPSDCRICHAALTNIAVLPVCEPCLAQIVPLNGPLCQICGEKLFHANAGTEEIPLCGICRRVGARFRRAAAYGAYEGALRELIHLFKYNGIRPAGKVLGGLLNQTVSAMALPESLIVIPVPLWSGKHTDRKSV